MRGLLDSLERAGTPVSYVTSFGSMARATRTGLTRLVEVRALTGDFPYYGRIDTDPPGGRGTLEREAVVLADSAVLVALQIAVGDSLAIGDARFPIAAALVSVPGEIGILTALGPRVYIPGRSLEATNLLRFGSRATYFAYLQLPAGEVEPFIERHRELFGSQGVGFDSAAEREEELTESLAMLARYLGLVGLIALLLGGIGVASAAHVFMKDRLRTAAILRCLGATSRIVFVTYLLQAALLGLVGAALGAGLGLVVQSVLPGVFREFLPLRVTTHIHWPTVFVGVGAGVWVAAVVALRPLLAAARVPALAALRRDVVERPWRSRLATALVGLVLAATVVALSVWQAPTRLVGYFFAGGVLVTTLVLWLVALLLIAVTRRAVPRRAPFVLRQGIGNLFRPQNQTVAVTLAVGFGVFLLGTLAVVQENLLGRLALNTAGDRPNLVLFDIQHDQRDGVEQIVRARGLPVVGTTPIVPSRIARLEGRPVDSVLADTLRGVPRSRWALRREYRNTYRATVADGERMVAGVWWDGDGRERPAGSSPAPDDPARISLEEDLAGELNVQVGDRITWDVQGRMIESVVTSLRRVDWVRFEPNFFVVFEPGVLEDAPQMGVLLARGADADSRARVQRDVVERFPNVAVVDLTVLQQTLDDVIGKVTLAIRFMALFSVASGILILVGALATSRRQRMREVTLLRTLGARARVIRTVLLTEYAALGLLAGIAGTMLSTAGGWAVARFVFELPFRLPVGALAAFWGGCALLTIVIGAATGRDLARRPPLDLLREIAE
jgi:putative ABC transport system permease protein